jgi:hypothetical protein
MPVPEQWYISSSGAGLSIGPIVIASVDSTLAEEGLTIYTWLAVLVPVVSFHITPPCKDDPGTTSAVVNCVTSHVAAARRSEGQGSWR